LGWRIPFLIIGIPAIFTAVLIMTVVVDPERGGQEKIVLEKEKTEASRNTINQSKTELDNGLELNGSANSAEHRFAKVVPRGDNNLQESKISRKNFRKWNDDAEIERQNYRQDESNLDCGTACLVIFNPSTYSQHLRTCTELLQTQSVLLILLQGAPGYIP